MVERLSTIRETRFNPWVRKIPWRRKQQPTPVLLPGKFHGRRSLVGYTPWVAKSQTRLSDFTFYEDLCSQLFASLSCHVQSLDDITLNHSQVSDKRFGYKIQTFKFCRARFSVLATNLNHLKRFGSPRFYPQIFWFSWSECSQSMGIFKKSPQVSPTFALHKGQEPWLDFSGGSVVKNLPTSIGNSGSIPGPGRA